MNQIYKVNIKCIVLTVKPEIDKRYILSIDQNDWIPPEIPLNNEILLDADTEVVKKMKEFIFTSDLELMPQLISIKQGMKDTDIDIIYGFIISYTTSLNNCVWLEFDLTQEKPYSKLILEVAQKLV